MKEGIEDALAELALKVSNHGIWLRIIALETDVITSLKREITGDDYAQYAGEELSLYTDDGTIRIVEIAKEKERKV